MRFALYEEAQPYTLSERQQHKKYFFFKSQRADQVQIKCNSITALYLLQFYTRDWSLFLRGQLNTEKKNPLRANHLYSKTFRP
jgi:hypothetical protein